MGFDAIDRQFKRKAPEPDLVNCPLCGGDGKETCDSPDHGLIGLLSFHDVGRLGCPVCGHHPQHKVRNGGDCEVCNGIGKMTQEAHDTWIDERYTSS